MKGRAVYSRESDEWETPQHLFDELNREFHFTLDPCATEQNHKCECFITKEQDGLKANWGGQSVFVNPPYSKVKEWVKKGYYEGCKDNTVVCMIIPARTDTKYFHNYIIHRSEIRFIKGRLRFGESTVNAPFPSMVVIWRGAEVK